MKPSGRKYINLVREFCIAEIKLREEGTILGFIWTLLYPFLMLLILYMLFSKRLGRGIEHYEIYLLIGILHWEFFSKSTSESLKSLISKRQILLNAYLPKTALILSSILVVFISFLFELIILGGFLIVSGVGFSEKILFFPFVVLIELLLIIAVSLVLSCLNVYFRDITHFWNVLLRIGFFLTPIFYPIPKLISEEKRWIYLLNPMTQIIIFARDILLFKREPSFMRMFFFFSFVLVILIASCLIFKKLKYDILEKM